MPEHNNSNTHGQSSEDILLCPICGHRLPPHNRVDPYKDLPCFPFCSKRCKLIDLGRWLDEEYRIEIHGDSGGIDNEDPVG